MKPLLFALVCAIAGTAAAQSSPPAPADAPSRAGKDSPSSRDPRVCLEFPTREQVIACAEKFRPRRPAAKP